MFEYIQSCSESFSVSYKFVCLSLKFKLIIMNLIIIFESTIQM